MSQRQITYLPPSDITPYYNNPRKNENAISKVAESIQAFGFQQPIVIDTENEIIVGHTRYLAALQLNLEEVPCLIADLSEAKKKAYRIADNRVGEEAAWDYELLVDELNDLDLEVDFTGFDEEEIDEIFAMGQDYTADPKDDEVPDVEEKAISETGDLWVLGEHRVLCGDATKAGDVEKILEGVGSYSVLTDPPYNIDFEYNAHNDKKDEDEYQKFCDGWFSAFDGEGTVFTPGPHNEKNYPTPRDRGYWLKRNATAGASCFYLRTVEPILFYGEFKEKRNTDLFDYSSGFTDELKKARQKSGVEKKHAPAKSMPFWLELLGMLKSEIIVDPMLGNGTTLIACEKTNRTCFGMEIDPHYVDVIVRRWQDYTGQQAETTDGKVL